MTREAREGPPATSRTAAFTRICCRDWRFAGALGEGDRVGTFEKGERPPWAAGPGLRPQSLLRPSTFPKTKPSSPIYSAASGGLPRSKVEKSSPDSGKSEKIKTGTRNMLLPSTVSLPLCPPLLLCPTGRHTDKSVSQASEP